MNSMPRGASLSYKFVDFDTPKGVIQRPLIPVTVEYPGHGSLDTGMIVDSGADFLMIDREFATGLGIPVENLPRSKTTGATGSGQVAEAEVIVTIGQRDDIFEITMPIQIPLRFGYPRIPLLGREPPFDVFDVSFRMAYAKTKGKFVLSEVTRRRKDEDYA